MSFPRYEGYKDSGVEWLGEVPSHWEVVLARRAFQQIRELAKADDRQLSATQQFGVVPQSLFMERMDQKVVLALSGTDAFKHVECDDFVISLRSFQGGIERSTYSGCVSPAYTVLRPRRIIEARFWGYLLKSQPFISALQTATDGIRDGKTIRYEQFGGLLLPFPGIGEQSAAANFLDRETAKIDALVEAQQRLIELLKEKRQALISHAVTKGLDPCAPMKDSGVEWLGQVPAHWTVGPLRRAVEVLSGYAFPSSGFSADPEDTPLLRGVNIGVGQIRWDEVVYWSRSDDDRLDAWQLCEGDIVLGMDRPWISDGLRVAQIAADDLPCLLLQRVAALRPNAGLQPLFLLRLLEQEAFHHHCVPEMTGVSVPHISPGQIGDFVVAIPPPQEQAAILVELAEYNERADELVVQAKAAIALLQERRAALISAAVTGKIDVGGLAAAPQEAQAA